MKAEKKARFLEELKVHVVASKAAKAAGLGYGTVFRWRHEDPEFAKNWDDVFERSVMPALEAVAATRALEGKSDLLLIFLAKAHNRRKYQDTTRVGGGPEGEGPIEVTFHLEGAGVRKPKDPKEG